MSGLKARVLSIPVVWDMVQTLLGAPEFKTQLYLSRLRPPCRLLDFGCANGHLGEAFEGFDYYGVDLDKRAIEVARQRHRGRPHLKFLAYDMLQRPFEADFFDAVLFAGTVHHLDDELLRRLLVELHHCLRPGGTIHLIDPVYREKDSISQKVMRRLDQGRYTRTVPQILAIVEPLELFR